MGLAQFSDALLEHFFDALSQDEDWYTGPSSTASLFAKTRYTSESVDIDWFSLGPVGGDEIWAKLGIFAHGGVCRLQDVATAAAQRRRGLASALVNAAIRIALARGAHGLVVCADEDYHALDLYRKLGFRELGGSWQLMRYPAT